MTIRVVVAEADDEQRKAIVDALLQEDGFVVAGKTGSGLAAMELVWRMRPDVLVCSMQLPGMDGFDLLQEIAQSPLESRPLVIITSMIAREYLVHRAFDMGAADYMVKPFAPQLLVRRIRRVFLYEACAAHTPSENRVERKLAGLLLQLGIPAHLSGYRFLQEAVRATLRQPQLLDHLMHDLYPRVAQSCRSTTCGVERSIRQAITLAWERGRPEETSKVLGRNVNPYYEKPTSGELIALVAEKMRDYM